MDFTHLLNDLSGRAPASPEAIAQLESLVGGLPEDFRKLLQLTDGGEGFVGDNYLMLWGADEIARYNEAYQVNEYAPGLLLFGSSGGGEGYAFDTRDKAQAVVSVPFVGMSLKYVRPIAATFSEFLDALRTQSGELH